MSLPLCYECESEMPHSGMIICEQCQKGVCVECYPGHGCVLAATRELTVSNPEIRSKSYQG